MIVIGAGAAGQYAAYELNNLGFDVKVLEARPRRHGMLHPPQQPWADPDENPIPNTTEVTTIAEGITGDAKVNWHYADVMDLDKNRITPILAEESDNDGLYMIGGKTILGDEVTKRNSPELYDYWDFYYDGADNYSGPDIDAETYICEVLGVCRKDRPNPGDPQHLVFNYYKGSYPGGEWLTRMDNIGWGSLAEMEKRWDLGLGEWGFVYGSWTDTLDELYFNQIVGKVQLNHTVTDIDTSGAVAAVTAVDARCSECHNQPGPERGVPIPDNGNHPRVTMTAHAVLSTLPVASCMPVTSPSRRPCRQKSRPPWTSSVSGTAESCSCSSALVSGIPTSTSSTQTALLMTLPTIVGTMNTEAATEAPW